MPKFSSPSKQAISVIKKLQGSEIKSVGTVRNYQSALTRVAEHFHQKKLGSLRSITKKLANDYLSDRAKFVGQSQLNMERQALQKMMQLVTNKLPLAEKLTVVKSLKQKVLGGRAYTQEQYTKIANAQHVQNSISTQLVAATGIRAHELYTLRLAHEKSPDLRPAISVKFLGREGKPYVVTGKGGLTRLVIVPYELSKQLESHRLTSPREIDDRGVKYTQYYNINAGARWSNSFTQASKRTLGYSNGGHGLRHGYAQQRMDELLKLKVSKNRALTAVSQELGHFRKDITQVYLR